MLYYVNQTDKPLTASQMLRDRWLADYRWKTSPEHAELLRLQNECVAPITRRIMRLMEEGC